MPYFAQYKPTFMIFGQETHPDRAKWGFMHMAWLLKMKESESQKSDDQKTCPVSVVEARDASNVLE